MQKLRIALFIGHLVLFIREYISQRDSSVRRLSVDNNKGIRLAFFCLATTVVALFWQQGADWLPGIVLKPIIDLYVCRYMAYVCVCVCLCGIMLNAALDSLMLPRPQI